MSAGSVPERLRHGVRAVLHPLGEFIHVSAIYLGLAVLTTLALSLVLPSMRQQSQQLHEVVLAMFQADGVSSYNNSDMDYAWAVPAGPPLGDESASAAEDPGPEDDIQTAAAVDQPEFMHFLAASMRDQAIPGVTAAQAQGLRSYLARKYRIATSVAGALVRAVFVVSEEYKLDPQLLLAVIAIESRYNPFVESSVGAQGLMQVMTRVHRDKLREYGGTATVFNPVVNIRIGTQILSDCIQRRGSVEGGLACYVGASGPSDGGYGAKVLAERRRIALASGIPLAK